MYPASTPQVAHRTTDYTGPYIRNNTADAMRSSTDTLIAALRVLSRDIYCEDGVAKATIAEAADRLEELMVRLRLTPKEREALENCIYASTRIGDDWSDQQAATLRGLLERMK